MADVKKFLDQSGVSTLWSKIAEEVAKVDAKAAENAADILAHGTRLDTAESKIAALEAGTYDDSEVRGLITANDTAIKANATAIATLNSGAEVVGSVANTANAAAAVKVAEIVAGANADFDTLKEIADWILNDTTGAADMANDIKALEDKMVGVDTTVVASIAAAIEAALKVDGADKFALASELSALAGRVKALEDAGYQNADQVGSAIDAKIAALDLANTYDAKGAAATAEANAKAYTDNLIEFVNTVSQKASSAMTSAQNAERAAGMTKSELGQLKSKVGDVTVGKTVVEMIADAQAYTDTEIAKIQALTPAEIDAAIEAAKAQA